MIAHSNSFKEAITKFGRDIHIRIQHYSIVYNLQTEDNKLILTQDDLELLTEPIEGLTPSELLTDDDIKTLTKNNLGEMFRTYMKSFDLETTHKFNVGDKMIINVGTTTSEDTIEYLNYGKYYVYERTYNEDAKTYTYTLCDSMLFTMIKYDNDAVFGNNTQLTCSDMIDQIISICNLDANIGTLVNGSGIIYKTTFDGLDMTYRDVLDMIMQSQGCSLVITYDSELDKDIVIDRSINTQAVETIDENILSDKNIKVSSKFGGINSLLLIRANGNDNLERKDDQDIAINGLCQYAIENNLVLEQENREDFIDNLFNKIKGLTYYTCDIDTIGLGYIEYLDMFEIQTQENLYNCLCLKDVMKIDNGMSENFKSEEPIEKAQKYGSTALSDKDAQILVNKLKGEIVLKTYQEDGKTKIAQVRLDSSGSDGSLVEISGDQIDLTGKTINLTSDTIKIESTKFKVDNNGNMQCNDATINDATINRANIIGGEITLTSQTQETPEITIIGNTTSNELWSDGFYVSNGNTDIGYFACGGNASSFYIQAPSNSSRYVFGEAYDGDTATLRVSEGSNAYCDYKYDGYHRQSDRRSKENIENIDEKQSIKIITDLKPVTYNYIDIKNKQRGLIAQDVKETLNKNGVEDMVYYHNKENDRYSLNYEELIPDLINCVKYQQKEIEELKKEIENLKGGNK